MTTTNALPPADEQAVFLSTPPRPQRKERKARVVIENTTIGELKVLHLVEQLLENASGLDQFQYWCETIWPGAEVYHGHTHVRVMHGRNSIYIDKGGQ
jgi:hypothetical protein